MSDVEHANYARMTRPGLAGQLFNESVALLSTELRKTNKSKCTFKVDLPDCDSLSHLIYHIPFTLSTHCVYYLWKVNPSSLYKRPHLRNSPLFNSECLFILETQPSFLLRVSLSHSPCLFILISYPSLALNFS